MGNIIQGEHQQVTINQGGGGAGLPKFEVIGGSLTHTAEVFAPGRQIKQISGEPVLSIEWRWCGPRFHMGWEGAGRQQFKDHVLSHEFRMAEVGPDPGADFPGVGKDEIGLEIRFIWRGQTMSEMHKFELIHESTPKGELFNLGREIFQRLPGYLLGE